VWASKRGHAALAAALEAGAAGPALAAAGDAGAPPADPASATLVIAPDLCATHHRTAPEPLARSGPEPPPENVRRLKVTVGRTAGLLRARTGLLAARLAWREDAAPAGAADVLRVHDWPYIRSLQAACASIPPGPAAIAHLDGDTAICRDTFGAALIAAGAVIDAVDAVVAGSARHAFCAVRPPGHHAGPSGVVPCANDPAGSHGFCLLNNVAIGAAYALSQYRGDGRGGAGAGGRPVVRRVAILDFGECRVLSSNHSNKGGGGERGG
jgi:acetoin utilization deacetylase AcuC-like enzyme